jgi:hypothetical protein
MAEAADRGLLMKDKNRKRMNHILGPEGKPLTIADLPPPDCTHWIPTRKGKVVIAVNRGLLSVDEVCNRYGLSSEEFINWRLGYAVHGLPGLKATGPFVGRPSNRLS